MDSNEKVPLSEIACPPLDDEVTNVADDPLYLRIVSELREAAAAIGETALERMESQLLHRVQYGIE